MVVGSSPTQDIAYRIFNSGQADQSVDIVDTGDWTIMQSFYVT